MSFSPPDYIAEAGIDDPVLQFVWDDRRASEDFTFDSQELALRLSNVMLRAQIAFAIGTYEWIVWRFRRVSSDPVPIHLAEAAWCVNVRREYMEYTEFDRDEWLGPIRGPLWCAATWLLPMLYFSDDVPEESESTLEYLPRLAVHVLPKPQAYLGWADVTIERLRSFYLDENPDPFVDLFGEREEERRGPLVPREALDPRVNYRPEMAPELVARYLAAVNYRENPLLRSPEELTSMGFSGSPYTL